MPVYDFDDKQPRLGRDVWIAPTAEVIGEARLGDRASVWFGAVIRADNTPIVVGDGTNIQEGAMLHSDPGRALTVGEDVTIGHHAMLHGCTVGDRVLIGMGATILNGAVIGTDSIVGACALVTENKVFPSNSLIVGSPAKAVRTLAPEEMSSIRKAAEDYVERSAAFANKLTLVGSRLSA